MRTSNTGVSPSGRIDAGNVVAALAGMLQVGFVYPANNPRFAAVCTDLIGVLDAFSTDGAPVEIEVDGDALCIGDERVGREREDAAWTIDRFDRAGLEGVRLDPKLEPRALIELTVALRTCFPAGAPRFPHVWKPEGTGVTPILRASSPERRPAPVEPRPLPQTSPAEAPPAEPEPRAAPMRSGRGSVLALLARSLHVRETLAAIHARFEEEFAGGHAFDAAGMLERLVADLPDAMRDDAETAAGQVETVLDLVLAQLEVFLLTRPDDPGDRLLDVAAALLLRRLPAAQGAGAGGQRDAARPPSPPAPPTAAPPLQTAIRQPAARTVEPVRPATAPKPAASSPAAAPAEADPAREARPPRVLDEIEKLPRAEDFDDDADKTARNDEVFGAGLHLLAFGRDERTVTEGAGRLLAPLIASPSPMQRRILSAYLRIVREGDAGDSHATARARLSGFLQSCGANHLTSPQTRIDFGSVVETFPEHFVEFLDTLDAKSPESARSFQSLADAVGAKALDTAVREGIEDGVLLVPNRTEKLLKLSGRHAARIAARLANSGIGNTREQVVNYLRRQELSRPDSAALAVIRPVDGLPSAYLADLCARVARGNAAAHPNEYSSLLLRQFVRDTADRPGDLNRRLYAIRALGHWPAAETVQYLEQLARDGRFRLQTKDGRAIRQAAADALAQIRAAGEQSP